MNSSMIVRITTTLDITVSSRMNMDGWMVLINLAYVEVKVVVDKNMTKAATTHHHTQEAKCSFLTSLP